MGIERYNKRGKEGDLADGVSKERLLCDAIAMVDITLGVHAMSTRYRTRCTLKLGLFTLTWGNRRSLGLQKD